MRNLLFLLIGATLFSCNAFGPRVKGNGHITTQKRDFSTFNKIDAGGSYKIILVQGNTSSISIDADDNIMEYIITRLEGNTLSVSTKNGYNIDPSKQIVLHVTSPVFKEIGGAGSCTINTEGKLDQQEALKIDMSGSCDAHIDAKCPAVKVSGSGSCDAELSGETRDLDISGSGSMGVKAFNLLAENVSVSISGSGSAEVFASKILKVSVSGSGDVEYKGAATVEQHISGSGSVKKVD